MSSILLSSTVVTASVVWPIKCIPRLLCFHAERTKLSANVTCQSHVSTIGSAATLTTLFLTSVPEPCLAATFSTIPSFVPPHSVSTKHEAPTHWQLADSRIEAPSVSTSRFETATSTAATDTQCTLEDVLSLSSEAASVSAGKEGSSSDEAVVMEAWEVVNELFVDARHKGWSQTQWQIKKKEFTNGRIRSRMAAYSAISTMLDSLHDPYSRFLTPNQFAQMAKYDITGVGLNIAQDKTGNHDTLKVLGIVLGSPAQINGMRQGDEILSVNGTSVAGRSAFDAASLVQGPKGTPVSIQFRHSACSPPETVTLVRTLDVKSPVGYRIDATPTPADLPWLGNGGQEGARVGYLRLREFNALAKRDLLIAIERLQRAGVTSFTLDLRDNPGGLVQAGIEIARLFLPEESTVIFTEGREPSLAKTVTGTNSQVTTAPLTVLVNRRTASASEIVAAALHDNCRAVLVGNTTFGKGLIQSVYELSDGSAIVLTVGKYVTPSHRDIDGHGIEPDFNRWPGDGAVQQKLAMCTPPVRSEG